MGKDTSRRFSPQVQAVLEAAGWFSGRCEKDKVESWTKRLVERGFEAFPAATDVLLEFGDLLIVQDGPGEECARGSLNLNPLVAEYESDSFAAYTNILVGEKLFPLGEHCGGQALLAIGELGKIYALTGTVWLAGNGIEDALERLIRGLRFFSL